ncbi:MAG TPA: FAD-dependent oxidoreductase [Roseiarcus sp.]|nr:FAD-dependent oxidoreductase [Roseiarcus sp.]
MSARGLNVLVIGGGFSGMSAAIQLRRAGASVDLIELDPAWRSYGAGISLQSAALRAFRTLGILDEFLKRGAGTDGVDLFTGSGHPIGSLPTPRLAGPDVPGQGAIMRPVLAAILAQATKASGAAVRLGATFTRIDNVADGVRARLTDGSEADYDLVIGADGLGSKTRATVFPNAPAPRYIGQCVWRAVLARPPEIVRTRFWMGDRVKVGVNPVSPDEMYMFVTEDRPTNDRLAPSRFVELLKALLAPFSDPVVRAIHDSLNDQSRIVYRPLEALLLPRPWSKDRVVLIGDATHATTPHLAAGACIGIEDAIVLAEELERASSIPAALKAFEDRRWERCRMVVENSLRLAEIEITGGDQAEHADIMRRSMMALASPI